MALLLMSSPRTQLPTLEHYAPYTLHVSLDIAGRAQSACHVLFSVRFVLCFVASTSLDLQARELRAVKARQLLSMSTVDVQLRFQSVIDPLHEPICACLSCMQKCAFH
jgi:hypothetical protein